MENIITRINKVYFRGSIFLILYSTGSYFYYVWDLDYNIENFLDGNLDAGCEPAMVLTLITVSVTIVSYILKKAIIYIKEKQN